MSRLSERCPKCGSGKIRFAVSVWKHHWRRFAGSRRRYCLSCEKKWIFEAKRREVKISRRAGITIGVVLLLLLVGATYLALRPGSLKMLGGAARIEDISDTDSPMDHPGKSSLWLRIRPFFRIRGRNTDDF